ncbi:unknown [Alistipes sp. CAG:831]|nr:unknown [Alistipes sp. CAG:831]
MYGVRKKTVFSVICDVLTFFKINNLLKITILRHNENV